MGYVWKIKKNVVEFPVLIAYPGSLKVAEEVTGVFLQTWSL